jgi:hypothetical protein
VIRYNTAAVVLWQLSRVQIHVAVAAEAEALALSVGSWLAASPTRDLDLVVPHHIAACILYGTKAVISGVVRLHNCLHCTLSEDERG